MALGLLWGAGHIRAHVPNRDPQGREERWLFGDPTLKTVNPDTGAIRFNLGAEGFTPGNPRPELDAVRAAFGQWRAVPGTSLKFEEGTPLPGSPDVNTSDNTNVVYWSRGTLVGGGMDSVAGRLAVNYKRKDAENRILESDIVFNGAQLTWAHDPFAAPAGAHVIESTALHEIGHFIGLAHNPLGAATMYPRSQPGLNPQLGLSQDEILAARHLYRAWRAPERWVAGVARFGESPVLGLSVCLEDADGVPQAGTLTGPDGAFRIPLELPGPARLRWQPLDPPANNSLLRLVTAGEIGIEFIQAGSSWSSGVIDLADPSEPVAIQVQAGAPPFRVTRIMVPAAVESGFVVMNSPVQVLPGTDGVWVGVASPDLPTAGATLRLTGPGLSLGAPRFRANAFPGSNPAVNLIYARLRVEAAAPPGPRTFLVEAGGHTAAAVGYLEIQNPDPDDNYDGLADTFQRRHFSPFTQPAAGPEEDPDADGLSNAAEAAAGTSPTDPQSRLSFDRATHLPGGVELEWRSVPGKSYQISGRADAGAGDWAPLGPAVKASGGMARLLLPLPNAESYFFRVAVIP